MIRLPRRSTLFPYTRLFRSLMIRLKRVKPAPTSRTPARPPALAGAVSSRIIVPSRKRLSRFGASRKSSADRDRSEEHTSELQSRQYLVCRLLLEKKKKRLQS